MVYFFSAFSYFRTIPSETSVLPFPIAFSLGKKSDPATGIIVGGVKGIGWGFTRFATGAYETFTFPVPTTADDVGLMYCV